MAILSFSTLVVLLTVFVGGARSTFITSLKGKHLSDDPDCLLYCNGYPVEEGPCFGMTVSKCTEVSPSCTGTKLTTIRDRCIGKFSTKGIDNGFEVTCFGAKKTTIVEVYTTEGSGDDDEESTVSKIKKMWYTCAVTLTYSKVWGESSTKEQNSCKGFEMYSEGTCKGDLTADEIEALHDDLLLDSAGMSGVTEVIEEVDDEKVVVDEAATKALIDHWVEDDGDTVATCNGETVVPFGICRGILTIDFTTENYSFSQTCNGTAFGGFEERTCDGVYTFREEGSCSVGSKITDMTCTGKYKMVSPGGFKASDAANGGKDSKDGDWFRSRCKGSTATTIVKKAPDAEKWKIAT